MRENWNWPSVALCLCASLAVAAGPLLAQPKGARDAAASTPKYIGPGSCAATSCHGSVSPVAGSRILQSEYSTWILQDKHSRAYQALTGEVGERMAGILKLGSKAENAPKCLACHALSVPPEQRGRPFELADGVSCESCHGPASAWLGPHTTRGWAHEKSLALGMNDTRNVIARTDLCLSCHLGTKEKFVDHEMIAAGHPDLYFELDSFSAVMPRHWKVPREADSGQPAEDTAWAGVRDWSAGQAEQLHEALQRLEWRARGQRFDKKDVWPEYSELSCFACHHALGPAKDSWRQAHGFAGRRPGDPAWNASRYAVFRIVAEEADAAAAKELARQMDTIAAEMSQLNPDRDAVATAAAAAAPLARKIASQLPAMPYSAAFTLRTMQRITQSTQEISLADERAAEQATMALDALYIAYSKNASPPNAADARAAINALFRQLENPSLYNADQFAAGLRRVGDLLR